ncbi:hypothetical protein ACIQC5_05480 [Paenarthrobacter sp. NPDC092416]|uniref:hypothetical protein n=1 Tax=Paenarthrobacter sp. NPDC092416 TaxID=3364386 RepID=UPI0037FB0F68
MTASLVAWTGGQAGSPQTASAVSSASSSASSSPSPTPTPSKIAGKACTSENATQVGAGDTYICGIDQTGKLVWLDSATAKKLSDQRAAEAAAKAAAEAAAKAAAEKAAADAAAKAAADKAAADQAAAEQAAAAQAAADKAAADQAAAAAPKPAPLVQSGCDPNYSGCVPVASDVDCAGGSGNGPAYVRGPVTVVGSDIYGLDSDKDGIGCEK